VRAYLDLLGARQPASRVIAQRAVPPTSVSHPI
jgi:hypothetical protein